MYVSHRYNKYSFFDIKHLVSAPTAGKDGTSLLHKRKPEEHEVYLQWLDSGMIFLWEKQYWNPTFHNAV